MSVHVLSGHQIGNMIKLQGELKRRLITILADSSNTHIFLDSEIAQELKVFIIAVTPFSVTVANGKKAVSHSLCPQLLWLIKGREFKEDLRILQLEGYDMILGGDWMRKYNPITFNFDNNKLIIKKGGHLVELLGAKEEESIRMISARKLQKLLQKEVISLVGQLFLIQPFKPVLQKTELQNM